jgi:adenine-specific DNA-methyltransferase
MTIEKLDNATPDLTRQNIERLLELFPECRTEGSRGDAPMVDFDLLRQALSDELVEGPAERYRLDWPGKRQALLTANAPIDKTLRPMREESVDFDTTRNLFIEGDNLDALKLLQETYLGKVKMIYIDPPYNTGNDFIYKDNFVTSRETYEEESGQRDDAGGRLVANPESNGRFHSDWLSMMYARLRLAKNLMHEHGVIFISIDDNEHASLIKLCDEIFGEKNFIGSFVWSKKRKGSFLSKKIVSVTEYIVAYGRSTEVKLFGGRPDENESQPLVKRTNAKKRLEFPPKVIKTKLPDGVLPAGRYGKGSSFVELENDAIIENGVITSPIALSGPFVWSQDNLNRQIAEGARLIVNTENLQIRAFKAHDPEASKGLSSLIDGVEIGATNEDGYEELMALFGKAALMDYPKPSALMRYLVEAVGFWDEKFIALDFFAGSGSFAHGALEVAAKTGKVIQTISVQIDERSRDNSEVRELGFDTIAELSRERIRMAGRRVQEKNRHAEGKLDTGFRAFRIDSGNFVDTSVTPKKTTQEALAGMVSHIKDDRSEEDLLFGALLRWGVDITLPIEERELAGRRVWLVDAPVDGMGAALIACFARPQNSKGGIDTSLADVMAELAPLRVLFRDDGFADDATKENVHSRFQQRAPDTQVRVL